MPSRRRSDAQPPKRDPLTEAIAARAYELFLERGAEHGNIQGSCNNLCDTAPDPAEYHARNQADIVWMQEIFDEAKAHRSSAIMLISQANPGWDLSDATRAPLRNPRTLAETDGQPDGFVEFLSALRDQVIAFRKPVAYAHGDSH